MSNNVNIKGDCDGKHCSICGKTYPDSEFTYGNKNDRSYCRKCDKEEKAAYRRGGVEAAHEYREAKRATWKSGRL